MTAQRKQEATDYKVAAELDRDFTAGMAANQQQIAATELAANLHAQNEGPSYQHQVHTTGSAPHQPQPLPAPHATDNSAATLAALGQYESNVRSLEAQADATQRHHEPNQTKRRGIDLSQQRGHDEQEHLNAMIHHKGTKRR